MKGGAAGLRGLQDDEMDHLSFLSEFMEDLNTAGSITEGQYLAGMNALGRIFAALPQHSVMVGGGGAMGGGSAAAPILSPQLTAAAMRMFAFNTEETANIVWMNAAEELQDLDELVRMPTPERIAAFSTKYALICPRRDGSHPPIAAYTSGVCNLRTLATIELSTLRWKDLDARDVFLRVPCVKRAAVFYSLKRTDAVRKCVYHINKHAITDAGFGMVFHELGLPFETGAKIKRGRVVGTKDVSDLHRVGIELWPVGSGFHWRLPAYTKLIQLGRTSMVRELAILTIVLEIVSGGSHPKLLERCLRKMTRPGYQRLVLDVSGITAATKDEHRAYRDADSEITRIRYSSALATGLKS